MPPHPDRVRRHYQAEPPTCGECDHGLPDAPNAVTYSPHAVTCWAPLPLWARDVLPGSPGQMSITDDATHCPCFTPKREEVRDE